MKAIAELIKAGFAFTVQGERIRYQWTRPDPPDPKKVAPLLEAIRADKGRAVEYLRNVPGDCAHCPASGQWDGYGPFRLPPGRYCFHSAVFMGKAARPVLIDEARQACPKQIEPSSAHAGHRTVRQFG